MKRNYKRSRIMKKKKTARRLAKQNRRRIFRFAEIAGTNRFLRRMREKKRVTREKKSATRTE